jgi:hypothetical protein
MDKRIKELAEQAGLYEEPNGDWKPFASEHVIGKDLERFAELVRQDYLRELKALKPVAWVTTEQFASTAHNVTRVTLHQEVNGIPLYTFDEVTK